MTKYRFDINQILLHMTSLVKIVYFFPLQIMFSDVQKAIDEQEREEAEDNELNEDFFQTGGKKKSKTSPLKTSKLSY